MRVLNVLLILFYVIIRTEQRDKYTVPEVTVLALKPKGLYVSIPDEDGVELFIFHAHINKEMEGKEEGTIMREVMRARNRRWSFTDLNIELKHEDVIAYWVFVQYNRMGYDKIAQTYIVKKFTDANIDPGCKPTDTIINNGLSACAKQLLFEDVFESERVEENDWVVEQYVAWKPDYEFVSYENKREINYLKDGILYIKPKLRENPEAEKLDLHMGCTGVNCTVTSEGRILPPVISGKLRTRLSFLYGKIEIRAQLPVGDWIFPQIYLVPKDYKYGEDYKSGRLWIAYARGNRNLITDNNKDIGNNLLFFGPVFDRRIRERNIATKEIEGDSWGSKFHTYTVTWKKDGFYLEIDGKKQGSIMPPNGAFSSLKDTANIPHAEAWKTSMAPFDQEFQLVLGVGVGGHADFPDKCTSNGITKPWRNASPQNIRMFYNNSDQWMDTWTQNEDDPALKVDYVKVWAL